MMSATPPALLVVDDDPAIRGLIEHSLAAHGFVVTTASNGSTALRVLLDNRPNLVILDVMLPGIDGLEVCRLIRQIDPVLPILMLTARDADGDEITALAAGADDYMSKPFSLEVLEAHVRALLRRSEHAGDDILVCGDLRMDVAARRIFRGVREITLTATEFEVLRLLLSHPGRVLAKEEIIEQVWSYQFSGDANIVEVYVASLRKKLGPETEPRLIHTVRGAGYVLRAP